MSLYLTYLLAGWEFMYKIWPGRRAHWVKYDGMLLAFFCQSRAVLYSSSLWHNIHPSKKVTQHHFDQLYQSVYGFIFIMLGIIWKLDYLSFNWYFICHDCFVGTCAGRLNWVLCQNMKVAKLDHNFNRWYQFVYEIFIVLGIIWKPIYFSFNWYIICYTCLPGMCAKGLY